MYFKTVVLLVLFIGSSITDAAGQTPPPNPTQAATVQQDQVPIFRVTVVGRTTQAINYRPRHGVTNLGFEGTPLLPGAQGRARIEGDKGVIAIDAHFDKLPPASRFGPEYLTYVLWAITPEGRATNLGELQVDGADAKLDTTTELQAFGLLRHRRAVLCRDTAERCRRARKHDQIGHRSAMPRSFRRSTNCWGVGRTS